MNKYVLDRTDIPNEPLNFEADGFALNETNGLLHFHKNNREVFAYKIIEIKTLMENGRLIYERVNFPYIEEMLNAAILNAQGHDSETSITPTEAHRYNNYWDAIGSILSPDVMPPKIDEKSRPIAVTYKSYTKNLKRLLSILHDKFDPSRN